MPDLSITLAGLKLSNPTLTCSGTCGYATEYADFMDLSQLGGFVTKSITQPGTYSSGMPFMPHAEYLRNAVHLRRLDELAAAAKSKKKAGEDRE